MAEPDADYDALMEEMGNLQEALDHADAWDLDAQLEQAMDALRCPPPDADVDILSGGERRRVALCKLLLSASPTCCCSTSPPTTWTPSRVQWLEQHLAAYPGAVLAVTHDRYFLDNVAQWIAEVDRGRLYPYEGNYSTYLEKKAERLEVAGQEGRQAGQAAQGGAGLGPLQRQGPAGQVQGPAGPLRGDGGRGRAHPQARLRGDPDPAGPAPGLHGHRGQEPAARASATGCSSTTCRSPCRATASSASSARTASARPPCSRPSSAWRSRTPATVKVGETVKISYVDQSRGGLDPKKNVWETVSDGLDYIKVGHVEMPSRAYVSPFGFKGPDQQKPAGVLSGGERNRLNLALTLKVGGNLLLLDEPTNDLDVETLGSLENALLDFPGCAVVISHDRWFLDRVATHILAYEGTDEDPAKWYWFEGNFESLREEQGRAARRGGRPAAPGHLPQAHPRLTRRPGPRRPWPAVSGTQHEARPPLGVDGPRAASGQVHTAGRHRCAAGRIGARRWRRPRGGPGRSAADGGDGADRGAVPVLDAQRQQADLDREALALRAGAAPPVR